MSKYYCQAKSCISKLDMLVVLYSFFVMKHVSPSNASARPLSASGSRLSNRQKTANSQKTEANYTTAYKRVFSAILTLEKCSAGSSLEWKRELGTS